MSVDQIENFAEFGFLVGKFVQTGQHPPHIRGDPIANCPGHSVNRVEQGSEAVDFVRVENLPANLLLAPDSCRLNFQGNRNTRDAEDPAQKWNFGCIRRIGLLRQAGHQSAQEAILPIGPLGIASQPEQIIGGPAWKIATAASEFHRTSGGMQEAEVADRSFG